MANPKVSTVRFQYSKGGFKISIGVSITALIPYIY